tara:strand:- start:9 stop:476 length:468 start_codon:yes stop_codon:yes gene_type:complete
LYNDGAAVPAALGQLLAAKVKLYRFTTPLTQGTHIPHYIEVAQLVAGIFTAFDGDVLALVIAHQPEGGTCPLARLVGCCRQRDHYAAILMGQPQAGRAITVAPFGFDCCFHGGCVRAHGVLPAAYDHLRGIDAAVAQCGGVVALAVRRRAGFAAL